MQKTWTLLASFCLTVLLAGSRPARAQSAAPAPTPSVDQVLDKFVQALGGKPAIQKITSRVAKGTFEMDQMPGAAIEEVYEKAPNKQLSVTTSESWGIAKRGFNGTAGWQDMPQAGLQDVTGSQLASMKRYADFYRDLRLKELYPKISVKGKESLDDHSVWVLEATPTDGTPELWSFDTESGLLVRIQGQGEGPNGTVDVDTRLGDYREVNGVKVPCLVRQSMGEFSYTIKLKDIKHNVPVDDAMFEKPTTP